MKAGIAIMIVVSLVIAGGPANATCGSARCFLVTGTDEGVTQKGKLSLDLSYRYVDQDRKLTGGRDAPEVLTPKVSFEEGEVEPDHHREIRTQNTAIQLALSYGLTERLTLAGALPIVQDRDHQHFDEVGTADEHFSGTDGTRGFGDVQVGARYALLVRPRGLLVGSATLEAPTGAHRLLDAEGAITEPTLQPGSGSWDGIAGLHWASLSQAGGWEWFASGSYRRNGTSDLEYRLGAEAIANAGVRMRPSDRWEASLQLKDSGRDRFLGEEVPSTGSRVLNLTPGLRFSRESGSSMYGFLQLPLSQRVNESQLGVRYGIVLGATF